MTSFETLDLGVIPYLVALQKQITLSNEAVRGKRFLLLVEHPPVVTIGKHTDLADVQTAKNAGMEIVSLERGGQATAHMLGQLLCYPLFKLQSSAYAVRRYVEALENTLLALLADYGLQGQRQPRQTGIWVQTAKIASIGIRIRARVCRHGLALNVNNDLSLFRKIVTCGVREANLTNMEQLLARPLAMAEVKARLSAHLLANLAKAGL